VRKHLDDYVAELERSARRGRKGRGARLLVGRILRLMDGCGWKLAYQVTLDSLTSWRNPREESARTLNYLQGMVSFLNWMERVGKIKSNPLKHVPKVDRGQRRRVRRAFTDEELGKLVHGSGPRGLI